MIQLYRDREYLQIWDRKKIIVTHRGNVGKRGIVAEHQSLSAESTAEGMLREADAARSQGFAPIPNSHLAKVLIHYRFQTWRADEVASFAEVLKSLIGDALGWTGNGFYDGFSVGTQELTLWYLVVDSEIAVETILEVLRSHNFLEDQETKASLALERDNKILFAYPFQRKGEQFM
jgi:hypothetical protein